MIIPVNTLNQFKAFQDRLLAVGYRWCFGTERLTMRNTQFPIVLHCDILALTLSWSALYEPAEALEQVLKLQAKSPQA
jgi:hypothetical protein